MEDIFIRLRKFNFRWAILISFVPTIIVCLVCFRDANIYFTTSIVALLSQLFFYASFFSQSVSDLRKALVALYLITGAAIINFIFLWFNLRINDYIDHFLMSNYFGWFDKRVDIMTYNFVISSFPTQLLFSFVSTCVFIFLYNNVYKKYRLCWICFIMFFVMSFINLLVLVTSKDSRLEDTFVSYKIINMFLLVLPIIIYIVLFFQGSNSDLCEHDMKMSLEDAHSGKDPRDSMGNIDTVLVQHTIHNSVKTATSMQASIIAEKAQMLFKLKELLDSGILTQKEFDDEKYKILT